MAKKKAKAKAPAKAKAKAPAKVQEKNSPGQTPGVKPFTIKYKILEADPVGRTSPNPAGYKYVRASWKDRETGKERIDIVILSDKEFAEAKKN